MRKSMSLWNILSFIFVLSLLGTASLQAGPGALDGKTFVGEIGEKGKTKGDPDTFIFKDGKFHSTACDKYGFGDGAYKTTASGNTTSFQAETTNAQGAKNSWNGKVSGDNIEGTLTMVQPGKAPVENWLKGSLKK